jgi:hypothetical protein
MGVQSHLVVAAPAEEPAGSQEPGLLLLHLRKLQAGAAASALVADLAAAQQAQAQLEDRLLAAQAALLQQKQQHKHDVSHIAVVHCKAQLDLA